ncbi:hypothetical protein LJ707_00445 [Mucilaginibacter sp. UR6-1]|uniref:hypothetical protein n=1 Tax=Mucilaginibacter sp. UR6-1 TaxID=1435643 RepID=UPI001E3387D4|nr:hypothetical protein [Mucilaginibacter sp. UR6-1]MCC8407380.1 hypothetical protein [Mucilaginibacter sp. UR6-1]
MGFKDWLPGIRYSNDDFFGQLIYHKYFFDKGPYWYNVKRDFKPVAYPVDIMIYADKHGPTLYQKDYFRMIESSYNKVLLSAIPMTISFLKKIDQNFTKEEFVSEFKLDAITLPYDNDTKWELTFDLPYRSGHILSINFESFSAKSIEID